MKAQTSIDMALLRRRFAPLAKAWERWARRIDALSLRERAFLFLCVVAVLVLLFDSLVLAPLGARAKARGEAQAQQASEMGQLREQFVSASNNTASAPAAQLQLQLEAARNERHRLDEALRQASATGTAEGLSALLQRVLAQQPGLVLEKLSLLEDRAVSLPAAGAAASAPMPGMQWQGVQLQVQGSYRDLQRYVQALERELPTLRWGEMRLTSGGTQQAPRLLAEVHLLKVQP